MKRIFFLYLTRIRFHHQWFCRKPTHVRRLFWQRYFQHQDRKGRMQWRVGDDLLFRRPTKWPHGIYALCSCTGYARHDIATQQWGELRIPHKRHVESGSFLQLFIEACTQHLGGHICNYFSVDSRVWEDHQRLRIKLIRGLEGVHRGILHLFSLSPNIIVK